MVTRRNLLVGSAAVLGTIGIGTGPAAAAIERSRRLASAALPLGAASGFPLPGGVTCPVPYLSRAAWGADESWRFTNGVEDWPTDHFPVQTLTVHHTGFAASSDPAETVRTIYQQQALTPARGGIKGWGDIGYNLLIDAAGVVYEGRYSASAFPVFGPSQRLMTTGAHVMYYNTGNIGVCLLGYLNDVPATQAAQDSLVTVLAYLAAVSGVNPQGTVNYYNPVPRSDGTHSAATVLGINGHRNFAATDCPGNAFYPLLGSIRQQVAGSMPTVPHPDPSPTAEPTPSSSPGGTEPTPSTSPTTTQPAQTTTPPPSPRSERGGDEYVPAARSASPKQFPTVNPVPSPTVDPVASVVPSPQVTPSWTTTDPTVASSGVVAGSDNTATVGITVVGALGALGAVGGWWLRQRRSAVRASTPSAAEPSTAVGPTVEASPASEPAVEASSLAELTVRQSTLDDSAE